MRLHALIGCLLITLLSLNCTSVFARNIAFDAIYNGNLQPLIAPYGSSDVDGHYHKNVFETLIGNEYAEL